jgi:hypothetical protein
LNRTTQEQPQQGTIQFGSAQKRIFSFFFFQNQLTGNLHIFIKIHHVSVKPLTYEILLIKMQLHTAKKFSSFGGKMALHVLLSIYSNNSHVG